MARFFRFIMRHDAVNNIAFGSYALRTPFIGTDAATALGYLAGADSVSDSSGSVHIGYGAGSAAGGIGNVSLGMYAGAGLDAPGLTMLGYQAGRTAVNCRQFDICRSVRWLRERWHVQSVLLAYNSGRDFVGNTAAGFGLLRAGEYDRHE
jgi:hypothetical protein